MSEENKTEGSATPSKAIKNLWRHSVEQGQGMSLKAFARKLVAEGNSLGKDWFDCKKGALDTERSEKNRLLAQTIGAATKASRKSGKK